MCTGGTFVALADLAPLQMWSQHVKARAAALCLCAHGVGLSIGAVLGCSSAHAQGWICNSSICMTRRGMRPTGIAIFEAQQKGFPSVAHFVQVHPRLPRALLPLPPVTCRATPARDLIDRVMHLCGEHVLQCSGANVRSCG